MAEEVEKLKAIKAKINELKDQAGEDHKNEQKVTPWDVKGAEKDGVQQVHIPITPYSDQRTSD